MKKIIALIICSIFFISFVGCGNIKTIDGNAYQTYGLFNKDEKCNERIEYRTIIGNVVWSIILIETIIAPVYFIGFSLYEPVGKKQELQGEMKGVL